MTQWRLLFIYHRRRSERCLLTRGDQIKKIKDLELNARNKIHKNKLQSQVNQKSPKGLVSEPDNRIDTQG